jgi:cytosine/adenosine deaminase-related metal-dependent hydrolase
MPDLSETERATIDVGSYPANQFYADLMRVTEGLADPDLADLLVNQSYPTMVWMRERGVRWLLATGRQAFKVGGRYRFYGNLIVEANGGGQGLSDMLFEIAERHGKPIDVHLDEHLDAARVHFHALIERTRAHGMAGKVVASHCSALSALEPAEAARVVDGFASAGIGVVTLPAANLFLQGRHAAKLAPRGLTRVAQLQVAGVTVAAASDNIQDPFVPTGSGDALEIARWALLAGHLGSNDLPRAYEMVTSAPAKLMGLDEYGVRAGARADLLVTDALDGADLVASGPLARCVLVNGRVVAGAL